MIAELNRWWNYAWSRPPWKAALYLLLVAIRAMFIGGGVLVFLTDIPTAPRAILAALLGVGMSVFTGVTFMRAREDDERR